MTIHVTHPLDENQFSAVAEQIGVRKKMMQKRAVLSKVISLSAIILLSLNLAILVVSMMYGAVAVDVESASSAERLAGIPVIGPITHWCFENILLGFKDVYAIVRAVIFWIAAPIVVAVISRIVGGLIIRKTTSASAGESAAETDQNVTVEKLQRDLDDLRSLAKGTAGVMPAKTCSLLVCLLLVGYLFYGAYLTEELDAFLNTGIFSMLIGMAVAIVVLVFVFALIMKLFMCCLRPVYRAGPNDGDIALALSEYIKAKKAEEQKRLEAMSTDELYEKAFELPLWDEQALQMMRIAAARGDERAENYLSEYEIHQEEMHEEQMSGYFREGRDKEAMGNYSRAKQLYKLAADMGHPDGMYNYARLAYKAGDVYDAKRYLKKSIDSGTYDDEHTRALLRAMESGQHINIV